MLKSDFTKRGLGATLGLGGQNYENTEADWTSRDWIVERLRSGPSAAREPKYRPASQFDRSGSDCDIFRSGFHEWRSICIPVGF